MRKLSVDYRLTNQGPGTATEAEVTNSTATDGAYLISSMPMGLGEVAEASYQDFTLKYQLPEGVQSIQTTTYLKYRDASGTAHYYPEKRDFYGYNAANQLTEVNDQDANITSFSYNANGALTEKTMGGVGNSYSYNGLDRLTGALTPTGSVSDLVRLNGHLAKCTLKAQGDVLIQQGLKVCHSGA